MTDIQEAYRGLEPAQLWRHFGALNEIPRPSGSEATAAKYIRMIAHIAGASVTDDATGNVLVRVPPTRPDSSGTLVALQAHLDMVCERRPEVAHNFATDAIRPRRDGDWIYASGTTLGADNGIGAAAALAVLTTPDLHHGPLELLFTVEEETGLTGAMGLDESKVQSRLLINLDSEDPRELTVGCAGGAGTTLRLPLHRTLIERDWVAREVKIAGLKGGHSGIQIHEPLANAIKLLTHVLTQARANGIELRVVSLHGGNAHNAIPRDAKAVIVLPDEAAARFETMLATAREELGTQWASDEPALLIEAMTIDLPENSAADADTATLLQLMGELPHGVIAMSAKFPGKVETSSNLAQIDTTGEAVAIATSSRSFVADELHAVQARIGALGTAAGAAVEVREGYPGWEPNPASRLLTVARDAYQKLFGAAPDVQVVHAGLECGVIVDQIPGMDAISFGPRIEGAHTPEERVEVKTVETTWKLLVAVLEALA